MRSAALLVLVVALAAGSCVPPSQPSSSNPGYTAADAPPRRDRAFYCTTNASDAKDNGTCQESRSKCEAAQQEHEGRTECSREILAVCTVMMDSLELCFPTPKGCLTVLATAPSLRFTPCDWQTRGASREEARAALADRLSRRDVVTEVQAVPDVEIAVVADATWGVDVSRDKPASGSDSRAMGRKRLRLA
jgi:hypothetical protein